MEMWEAEIEYWKSRLNRTADPLTSTELASLRKLFNKSEYEEILQRQRELEAEMEHELLSCGETNPTERSDKLKTSIQNVAFMSEIHFQRMDYHRAKYLEHRGYIVAEMMETLDCYKALSADERRFWVPPVMAEDGKWMEIVPQGPIYRWTAVRPELLSPLAIAILETLEHKLEQ